MAFLTPTSKPTGTTITAAIWNQDVVDNVIYLKDEVDKLFDHTSASQTGQSGTVLHNTWGTIASVTFNATGRRPVSFTGQALLIGGNQETAINWRITRDGVAIYTANSGALGAGPFWSLWRTDHVIVDSPTAGSVTYAYQLLHTNNFMASRTFQSGSLYVAEL